jgi:SAM-dependent methyltransferase
MSFTEATRCRSCEGDDLSPVIDLGEQPLANALRRPDDPEPERRFPLALVRCGACSLVQLTGTVDPKVLFDDYHYFSSFSTTMIDAMRSLANRTVSRTGLGPDSLVVEVASNDGYLLQHYRDLGIPILGIDPARNVADAATARGIPTEVDYFDLDVAERLRSRGCVADVIHANNVMAHVPGINGFVAGIARLLADGGVAVIETPHLVRMIEGAEFDTIYHEHVFHWSLTAVNALMARHDLVVIDVERLSIHGGSLRLFVSHAGAVPSAAVAEVLAEEDRHGVATAPYYQDFADRVDVLRDTTTGLLRDLKAGGATIAAYGAAAKGAVLLNHFGIGHELIDYVVDRNTGKQGLLVPGTAIPIDDPARLLVDRPDHVLLLTWNFADEIIGQQAEYLAAGGRFIVPIPELRVVTA